MANIGIYGGAFNPPHKGHMLAAAQCRAALGLERVIVIPAAVPPHKALADGSPDAQTRLALTKLAVKGLDGFEVSDLELHRSGQLSVIPGTMPLRSDLQQAKNALEEQPAELVQVSLSPQQQYLLLLVHQAAESAVLEMLRPFGAGEPAAAGR